MKKLKLKTLISATSIALMSFVTLSGISNIANAQVLDGVKKDEADKVILNLSKNAKISVDQVNYVGKTEFPGLYLVMFNGYQVTLLTDVNAKTAMVGELVNVETRASLSQELKDKHYKIDLKAFKPENMIPHKIGNGKNKVYVVADANCTFCQKLETESIPELKDVTIYNIPVSILQPGGPTDDKVKTILCLDEKKQAQAWTTLLKDKKGEVGKTDCSKAEALNVNTETMRVVGISGTPGIILPNGKLLPGWVPGDVLQQEIEKNQK